MTLRLRLALTVLGVAAPVLVATSWYRLRSDERAEEASFVERVRALLDDEGRAACEVSPADWYHRHSIPPPAFQDSPQASTHARSADGSHEGHDAPRGGPSSPWMGGEGPARKGAFSGPRDHAPPPGGPPRGGGQNTQPAEYFPLNDALTGAYPEAPAPSAELLRRAKAGETVVAIRRAEGRHEVLEVLVNMPWQDGPCSYVLARHHSAPWNRSVLTDLPGLLLPIALAVAVMLLALGPVVQRIRALGRQVRDSAKTGYETSVDVVGADELSELASAFNNAASEVRKQLHTLEHREQTLRDFLDGSTHDLMTPLAVLTGHLSTLSEIIRTSAPAETTTIDAAMNEVHYIASLLHNLGAAAKLEAGEPQIRRDPVSLVDLVERVIGRMRPIARLTQVSLDHAVPPSALSTIGDITLMEQAISNVVQNAVKHNHPGGHVAVVLDEGGDGFVLDILDDGPGIPEPQIPRLLRARERGDGARSRDPDGRGLGLSIAKQVAELHDWTMTLSASEFGGLRVRFTGRCTLS